MRKKLNEEVGEVAAPAGDRKIGLRAALWVLFICLLWGGNGVAIKVGLQGIPPLALAGLRFGLGFICIATWALWARIPLQIRSGEFYPLTLIGLLFTLQISLLNLGIERTLVIYSTIIFSLYPFFIALLAHYLIPGDQLAVRGVLGLLVAFGGVIVLFLGKLGAISQKVWIGNLLTLLSSMCLGTQFVYTKKIIRKINPIKLLFWQMVYSVPAFFLLSLLAEKGAHSYVLTPKVLWALLYQGIVVAGFCFIARNLLLKYYPASKLSAFFFTSPLFGIMLSVLILREPITPELLVGGGLIGVGIYLINSR